MLFKFLILPLIVSFSVLLPKSVLASPTKSPGRTLPSQPQPDNIDGTFRQASEEQKKAVCRMIRKTLAGFDSRYNKKISWFDLDLFLSEIESVNLIFNLSDKAIVGSNGRTGSVNFPNQKEVILNVSLLGRLLKSEERSLANWFGAEIVLVHEFLGALGYPDDNYLLSNYLWMQSWSNFSSPEVLMIFRKILVNYLNENERLLEDKGDTKRRPNGTSTVVGGGGDPASAGMKQCVLQYLTLQKSEVLSKYGWTETQYLSIIQFIAELRFEPMKDSNGHYRPIEKKPIPTEMIQIISEDQSPPYLAIDTRSLRYIKLREDVYLWGEAILEKILPVARLQDKI